MFVNLGLAVDGARPAIVVDGYKDECAFGNQQLFFGTLMPVDVGFDMNIHRRATYLSHVREYTYEIADIYRTMKSHCIDCYGDHTPFCPFGSNDATRDVHLG